MSRKSMCYTTTCIELRSVVETEARCYEILNSFGKYRKVLLQFLLTYRFPEYYKTGKINIELNDLIKNFSKDFVPKADGIPVFFGWHYLENPTDKLSDALLNKMLRGGAKDFIVYLMTSTLSFAFSQGSENTVITATPEDDSDDDETIDFMRTVSHQFDHMNKRDNDNP